MSIADLLVAFQYAFVKNMFIAGLLASVACGIIGTYVVVKRLVFISGGIAHTCFGGIGLAYWLGFEPMLGAVLFALGTAVTVGITGLKGRVREDSAIGALWVTGMALGLVFIDRAPGIVPDPISILFGNILLVKTRDLWLMLILDLIIVLIVAVMYRQLLALTFDEEFARITGIHTDALYIVLLGLIALTVVLLVKVVGVILVIALLTLPPTIAGFFTNKMKRIMIIAVLIGMVVTTLGSLLSWEYNVSSGPVIVLVAVCALLVSLALKRLLTTLSRGANEPTPEP